MNRRIMSVMVAMFAAFVWSAGLGTQQASAANILIHMKTSLAEDDAQICAVPNVAWAAVKAGHKVTILVDASAVTSVTRGFGWFSPHYSREFATKPWRRLARRVRGAARTRGILETVCRGTERRACPPGCRQTASRLVAAAYRRLQ